MNAIMVGGRAATLFGKSNERRRGGACKNAGKRARMVNMWIWDTQRSLVGWR
jgi:hypothetical protein